MKNEKCGKHSQRVGECSGMKRAAAALTIVELLVVIVIVGVIAALTISAVLPSRRESRRLKCLAGIRECGLAVTMYAGDAQDSVPAYCKPGVRPYAYHPWLFGRPFWGTYSGTPMTSPQFRCPDDTRSRNSHYDGMIDYLVSPAMYLKTESMRAGTFNRPNENRDGGNHGKVQRLADVAFPSQKSLMFEDSVWHAWDGFMDGKGRDVRALTRWGTKGKVSVSFVDGHVRGHAPVDCAGYLRTSPLVVSGHFAATIDGVRGIDVR
jgi:prepilin-type processing-associated H-X9-DG protein